jgi:hypothetical protein
MGLANIDTYAPRRLRRQGKSDEGECRPVYVKEPQQKLICWHAADMRTSRKRMRSASSTARSIAIESSLVRVLRGFTGGVNSIWIDGGNAFILRRVRLRKRKNPAK